ncbi:cytochrome P450 [Fodinicola feengrottensis]|uniref:Cytochrome P450 n=1 Tax=Fodinicola feengrottensis TaxID=435914 RepID=A0ABN2GPK5_9ACTN|nr:cytochrome P450 [Fodinicola feengrottensis]
MASVRARVTGWIGRKYLSRALKKGFDPSAMSFLPDSALLPLRRDGLDPVAGLRTLREQQPISKLPIPFGMTVWLVTGYAEAKAALSDADAFSNDFVNLVGNVGVTAEQNPGGLGFTDPPAHTRLRRLLTPEFTMRRLSRLAPLIQSIVDDQLDIIEKTPGPVDLVQTFALPIPSLAICELLGVPYEDRADFQRLGAARFDLFAGAGASLGAINESLAYLLDIVKGQREKPGDGLLGMLVKEHGDQVSDRELAELADGLLTGGFETTASMLALGALVLLRDPESFALLSENDEAVNPFVEELLRYLTVVQVAFPRLAKKDLAIAGTKIASGDIVLVSLSGANRDASLGAAMDSFDRSRPATSHLAFGHGIHRCIGAELARMELRTAYPSLVRRFPKLRLADGPDDLAFRQLSIVYGVEALPVRVD